MKNNFTKVLFLFKKRFLPIIMKTFFLLFCTTLFSFTPKSGFSQNAKIKIESKKTVSVDEVFEIIKSQTNHSFIYRADLFKNYPKVNLEKGVIRENKLLKKHYLMGNLGVNFLKMKL